VIPPGYMLGNTEDGARVGRIEARLVPPPGVEGEPESLGGELRFSRGGEGSEGCVEDPAATLEADDAPLDVYVEIVRESRMVVCLPPTEELPQSYPIRALTLHLDALDASAIGDVAWTGFFRPRVEGDAEALQRTTASRSVYLIPSVLELYANVDGKAARPGDRVTFTGYVKQGGAVAGRPVTLWAGRDARHLRPVGRARTDLGGAFSHSLSMGLPGELVVQARLPERNAAKTYCEGENADAPAGCDATVAGLKSPLLRVRVSRP
jgi:hypothetical protein